MNVNAQEGEAREIRAAQDGAASSEDNPGGEGGINPSGGQPGGIGFGASGAVRPWGDLPDSIAGGIIGQLIGDTQDRLAEAEECIAWYTREREKCRTRLQNLQALQQLATQETKK